MPPLLRAAAHRTVDVGAVAADADALGLVVAKSAPVGSFAFTLGQKGMACPVNPSVSYY